MPKKKELSVSEQIIRDKALAEGTIKSEPDYLDIGREIKEMTDIIETVRECKDLDRSVADHTNYLNLVLQNLIAIRNEYLTNQEKELPDGN